MPPFPFPKELFPPGTFPPGMKFSTDFHMPPAVEELLENGGPDALAAMMGGGDAAGGPFGFGADDDDDDEWEEYEPGGDAGRSARSRGARSSRRGPGPGSGSSRRGGRGGGRGGFPGGAPFPGAGTGFPGFPPASFFGGDTTQSMPDDEELERMFAAMGPGAFENMLREDARAGGAAGEEAAALLEMLENDPSGEMRRAMMAGMGGGGGGADDLASEFGGFGLGGARRPTRGRGRQGPEAERRAQRRWSSSRSRWTRRGRSRCALPSRLFRIRRAATTRGDEEDEDDDEPSSPAPGANAARNKKKKEKAKAKKAAAEREATTGTAPDDSSSDVPAWSPKPPFASYPSDVDRPTVKRWCDAAKDGQVGTMRAMLDACPALLHARGTGIGHTALHWACARGESGTVAWLLTEAGSDPNAVNSEGATPLHAAAANGQMDAVLALARHGADPGVKDENGERAGDAARSRGHAAVAAILGSPIGSQNGPQNGQNATSNGATTSHKVAGDAYETEARPRAPSRSPRAPPRSAPAQSAVPAAADDDSSSSDDEDTKTAKLAKMSAEAKQKGNAAFSAGDYPKAVKQFTMAIRMDKQNHVLFSNRSAAYTALGKYEEGLADAERCVRLAPKWGKGYGRKGAALTGLGQGGEAVKAYLAGLGVEPESEALRTDPPPFIPNSNA